MRDGAKVDTAAAGGAQSRPELAQLFERHVYGRMPPAPTRIDVDGAFQRRRHAGWRGDLHPKLAAPWDRKLLADGP